MALGSLSPAENPLGCSRSGSPLSLSVEMARRTVIPRGTPQSLFPVFPSRHMVTSVLKVPVLESRPTSSCTHFIYQAAPTGGHGRSRETRGGATGGHERSRDTRGGASTGGHGRSRETPRRVDGRSRDTRGGGSPLWRREATSRLWAGERLSRGG